jgi:hypothetical protein
MQKISYVVTKTLSSFCHLNIFYEVSQSVVPTRVVQLHGVQEGECRAPMAGDTCRGLAHNGKILKSWVIEIRDFPNCVEYKVQETCDLSRQHLCIAASKFYTAASKFTLKKRGGVASRVISSRIPLILVYLCYWFLSLSVDMKPLNDIYYQDYSGK